MLTSMDVSIVLPPFMIIDVAAVDPFMYLLSNFVLPRMDHFPAHARGVGWL
jgi:hypothetical protein